MYPFPIFRMKYDQENFGPAQLRELAEEMKRYSTGEGEESEVHREVNEAMTELAYLDIKNRNTTPPDIRITERGRYSLAATYIVEIEKQPQNATIISAMLNEIAPKVLSIVKESIVQHTFNIRKIAGDIAKAIENVLGPSSTNKPCLEQFGPQEMVRVWQAGPDVLPEKVDGFIVPRNIRELITKGVGYLEKAAAATSINKWCEERMRDPTESVNNFWNSFTPRLLQQFQRGEDSGATLFVVLPFAVNQGREGAWSAMCAELPDDVRDAMLGADKRDKNGGRSSDAERPAYYATMRKLARYLVDKKGVPLSFL